MKKTAGILALLCVFLWAGTVLAYPVTLYETGVNPAQVVNVSIPSIPYSGGVLAGVYQLNIDDQPFSGYCIDPAFAPSSPTLYDIVGVPKLTNYERAAYLFDRYGTLALTDPTLAANIQLAIWRIVFPPGFTIDDAGWVTSSQKYYDEAMTYDLTNFDSSAFRLAQNPPGGGPGDGTQDYIIRTPVPEPGVLILLGLGLIGLAGIRRKF